MGVPILYDLDTFYNAHTADLAVISSPIQLHADQTCFALAHRSNVLVEKPAAAVPADVDRMIEARDEAGRFVAVGFQWSFSEPILDLKRDALAGRFGEPHGGRSLTLWSRPESYYARNDWAGRRHDAAGRWILDSPVCNAMAHDLHNLLFLLGGAMDRSAEPIGIGAQLARVNDIETFDTVATRVMVEGGSEVLFLASHAVAEHEQVEPRFTLEFEQAAITFAGQAAPIVVQFHDGRVTQYASPYSSPQVTKLWACIDAVHGDKELHCGLEAARPHTACVQALEVSGIVVQDFPQQRMRTSDTKDGPLRWVDGLAAALQKSYETGDWPGMML
jgi:predicted dehydrogenase